MHLSDLGASTEFSGSTEALGSFMSPENCLISPPSPAKRSLFQFPDQRLTDSRAASTSGIFVFVEVIGKGGGLDGSSLPSSGHFKIALRKSICNP